MSGLTPADRAALAELIAAELARTSDQLAALSRDFDAIVGEAEMATPDDEHDPEGATLAFERAQVTALLSQTRNHLADLRWAQEQLRRGTYGTCQRCGAPIPQERLAALPAARKCVACAAAPPTG